MKNVFLLHGTSCKLDDCFGLKLKEELSNMEIPEILDIIKSFK